MDARNMPEYLRIGRRSREHSLKDVMGKVFMCKAISKVAGIYLPHIVEAGKIVTIKECDFKGELIPDGITLRKKVSMNNSIYLKLANLGKRFRIIKIRSQSLPYDHRQLNGQLNTQEVPKDGGRAAEEPSPGSGEGL